MFVDTITEKTMTPYQYVDNNPVNLVDTTEMSTEGPGDLPSNWDFDELVVEEIVISARGQNVHKVRVYENQVDSVNNENREDSITVTKLR